MPPVSYFKCNANSLVPSCLPGLKHFMVLSIETILRAIKKLKSIFHIVKCRTEFFHGMQLHNLIEQVPWSLSFATRQRSVAAFHLKLCLTMDKSLIIST